MFLLLFPCLLLPAQEPPPGKKQESVLRLMPLPTHPVLHVSGKISIDGAVSEWPKRMPALMLNDPRQLSGTAHGSWRGTSDLSAGGMLLWNESHLYLALRIADDWQRTSSAKPFKVGGQIPPGDSIHLIFDPRRDTQSHGPDEGRVEDREFWIGRGPKGTTLIVPWNRRLAQKSLVTKARARVLYDQKQKAYTVEIAIPWKEILSGGLEPRTGLALDFQIVINDFDEPLDTLPQTRIGWTFGSSPVIDPAVFGTLVLAGDRWTSEKPPRAPKRPEPGEKRPDRAYWYGLLQNLISLPVKPGLEGLSGKRGRLLRVLEDHLRSYPRLDYEQLLILMQRRMRREFSGYLNGEVPYLLAEADREILRTLSRPYKGEEPGVLKLPGRGFLVRSLEGTIAISPAGPLTRPEVLAGECEALFYARALDNLDRCDPLSFRMFALDKRVLTHIAFHFPGLKKPMEEGDLVSIGEELTLGKGIRARILGQKTAQGQVSASAGIQLTWPSGFTLVYPSLAGSMDQVVLPGEQIDLLILDPDNPQAEWFLKKGKPRRVLLEGFLDVDRFVPGSFPRSHRLAEARKFIEDFARFGAGIYLLIPGQGL